MTWTLHPIDRFAEYAKQWDQLVQLRQGTPFLESAFLVPALSVFGTDDMLLCLELQDGKLTNGAIVQQARTGMWETFQPSQLPLGTWISDGRADLACAMQALISRLPGLTLGLGAPQLDSRDHPRPADTSTLRTQDYIETAWVEIDANFDAYWETRGKNLRQNSRKQRNKLKAGGTDTRLECIVDPAGVADAIRDYGHLESAGWKAADGTAVHPDNDQGRFYTMMLESFCSVGRGRIYRYWFGEQVVAMDLCIHDDTAIVILKTTYDESYRVVSPSTLMRQDQFQQLFEEQKFKRIEFFGKVMEWHMRWTDKVRSVYHANAYRHALVLRALDVRDSMRKAPERTMTDQDTTHG